MEHDKKKKRNLTARDASAPARKRSTALDGKIGGQGKKKDSATSLVFKDNRNFAEVFNHTIFASRPVSAEDLSEDNIKETAILQVTEGAHISLTRYRDAVKGLKAGQQLVVLGIENQSEQNYQMPFRVMEMDFINYARQIRIISEQNLKEMKAKSDSGNKTEGAKPEPGPTGAEYLGRFYEEDRLEPCITLVIYWGSEPWRGPRRLSDMFSRSEWSAFASDYEMHLLEVQQISDSDLDSYNDELKMIFGFVKYAGRKEQLMNFLEKNEDIFTRVSGTAVDAIAELTHSSELKRVKETKGSSEGGIKYNMCQAIREMIEDGREEGRGEGRIEGRKEGREEGRIEGRKEGRKEGREEGRKAGRREEQKNTERERLRAITAERKVSELQEELQRLKTQLGIA